MISATALDIRSFRVCCTRLPKIGTSQPDRLCAQFQNLLVLRIDTLPQIPIFCQKLLWGSLTCLFFPVPDACSLPSSQHFLLPGRKAFYLFPSVTVHADNPPIPEILPYVFPLRFAPPLENASPFLQICFYCFQLFFLGQVSIPPHHQERKKSAPCRSRKSGPKSSNSGFLQTGLPENSNGIPA